MVKEKYYKTRAALVMALLFLATFVANAASAFTLVIDAGHGGHDAEQEEASQTKKISTLEWRWLSEGMWKRTAPM